MDTPERPDAAPESPSYPPPAPLPPAPPTPPAAWDEPAPAPPPEEPTPRAVSPKLVWRALRRHWWQVLLLWAAGSAGLMAWVYYQVKPAYEAIAWLKIEPTSRSLLAERTQDRNDFGPYLKTQVLLITSPHVLENALHDPKVEALPRVVNSLEPESELRKELDVAIQRDTHVIWVRMVTPDPAEGPLIVNAVVEAYRKAASRWSTEEMDAQLARLRDLKTQLQGKVVQIEDELTKLSREQGDYRDFLENEKLATLDEFHKIRARLTEVQVGLYMAEAEVDYLNKSLQRRTAQMKADATEPSPAQIDAQVEQLFNQQPEVAELLRQIADVEKRLEQAGRVARVPGTEPLTQQLKKELKRLEDRHDELWKAMYWPLRQQLRREPPGEEAQVVKGLEDRLRDKEMEVNRYRHEEELLKKRLGEIDVQTKETGDRVLRIKFLSDARAANQKQLETVEAHIAQLEFEQHSTSSINVIAPAPRLGKPTDNNRLKLMAAAPVGVLFLVLGLFTLVEARAARVADPDDLPSRVRLGVLGVVPPLPALRSPSRGLRRGDDRRRVEEFVQSLDHLRVALYASRPDGTRRRCVLITSAIGGEGKTTLAAQRAGRCANAGLLTLLVDADLRRPSLGELLEVPEGPGLAEVLSGEASPEDAMVVIGNAGGFHLLPAGAPGRDPSRLLHGERLGQLLAQLRSTFDVVIVDAPPVLAVPDALLLGRWTDGAVLAVRHDTSRFPLVERANRRLESVGIPVLGAVVNGCRTMESNYGAYQYNPYAGRGEDAGA